MQIKPLGRLGIVLMSTLGWLVPGQSLAIKLKKAEPIVCRGDQQLKVTKRLIETNGDAVVVGGSCTVTITNSKIIAGGYGVRAIGQGDVVIKNSVIEGAKSAVIVAGTGDVYARRSVLRGGVKRRGNGNFYDKGDNQITAQAPRRDRVERKPPPDLKRVGPFSCRGAKNLRISNALIRAKENAITVTEGCSLVIDRCWLFAGENAVVTASNGVVRIQRSYIEGRRAAVLIRGRGDVQAKGSTFKGRVKKRGDGDFKDEGGNIAAK
jgi:hypothetical protein